MKLAGMIACAALGVAGIGAAHAQSAACGQVSQMIAMNHAQVKALQGAQIEEGKDDISYTSKTLVAGFKGCKLTSDKAANSISDYWEHHMWCDGEAASSDAATAFVEQVWSCTKDLYSERAPNEAWMGGRYRIISFEAEAPTEGRAAGLVDFGNTEYARVVFEKSYDTSDEYNLHIYWMFAQ